VDTAGLRMSVLSALLLLAPNGARGQAHSAGEQPARPMEVKVGSEVEFPPYAMVDKEGQAAGFSVDLLRAVAGSAGLATRITTGPWDQVWRGLVAGDLDILPIVAVSEERRKLVDFGLPHTETFDAFFVRRGEQDIPDLRAAEGKTVGVMRSDAAHHELDARGFRGRVELVETIPEGLRRVAEGKIDTFLCSKLVGVLAMREQGIEGLAAGPPIPDYKRVFAFGLRKGAGDLRERLDQGLLLVKASGEYDRIYERWLSFDDPWRRYRRYLPASLVMLGLGAALATIAVAAQRRRARLLRSILDTAQDGFWLVGPDGRILSVNDAACALSGYTREELLRMTPADVEAAERPDEVKGHLAQVANAGRDRFLTRHKRKDGAVIDVEVSVQVLPHSRGRMVAFLRDVTARKLDEEAIREREAKLRAYFESPAVGIAITSPEKGLVEINATACSMLGYSQAELASRTWAELTHPEDLELDVAEFRRVIAGEIDSYALDKRFIRKDGSVVWVLLSVTCVRRADRSVDYFIAVMKDISRRKEAESALADREAETRAFLDAIPIPVFRKDGESRWLVGNRALFEVTGKDAENSVGRTDREIYDDPAVGEAVMSNDRRIMASGSSEVMEETISTPTGLRTFHTTKAPFRDASGRIVGIVGSALDITDRKLAEEALQASESRFRALFTEMNEGCALGEALPVGSETPEDYRLLEMNEGFERHTGLRREEVLGRPITEVLPGIERSWIERFCRVALTGEATSFESYNANTDRHYRVHSYSPSMGQFAMLFTDITPMKKAEAERASLQQQLALSSRLSALGTLVAGVAHEINNPLAAALSDQDLALGAVQKLRDRLRGSGPLDREAEAHQLDEVVEELGEAQEAGRRIERIVKDLKVFGRPNQRDARERIRLIDVVDLAMRWLPATIHQTATVTVENGGAPDVVATAGQITQVVVNLVTNAAKAASDGVRGAIVIRVGPGTPGMARLEVIDHGSGIEPAVLPHIFEPFFTTSDVGKGTGLGLSICHSIVTAHGGTLTVESEAGKGSTFRLELPTTDAEEPPTS
jgi:PAS domain S-box-containing protein